MDESVTQNVIELLKLFLSLFLYYCTSVRFLYLSFSKVVGILTIGNLVLNLLAVGGEGIAGTAQCFVTHSPHQDMN